MAHKSFAQGNTEETPDVEPISFDLADEKDLVCRRKVNGKLLIGLVGKVDSGSVALQSEGILEVFEVSVLSDDGDAPDEYTGKPLAKHTKKELADAAVDQLTPGFDPSSSMGRLNSVLDDPDTEISVDELADLVGWLVEQYTSTNAPKASATNSSGGTKSTRATSRRTRRATGGTGAALTSVPAST